MVKTIYTAASHNTWYEHDAETSEGGQKRHDVLDLVLKEHELPQTAAFLRTYRIFYPSEHSAMESFRDVACRVSWVGEACCSHDVDVEVSTLFAYCPYCGESDTLHDKNWLMYEDAQSCNINIMQYGEHGREKIEEKITIEYDGGLRPKKGSFKPLLQHQHPFGNILNHSPWERFIEAAHQQKLPSEDFAASDERHTFGLTNYKLKEEGFQGLYECPCCHGVFQVNCYDPNRGHATLKVDEISSLINELGDAHAGADCTRSRRRRSSLINDLRHVRAEIVSDERSITVTFEPRIGVQHIRFVCFDLVRGSFTFDGAHLFTGGGDWLSVAPADMQCEELSKTLAEILCEYTASTKEAIEALVQAREYQETMISTVYAASGALKMRIDGCETFLDLAIANRFRGYPRNLYEGIYDRGGEWDEASRTIMFKIREATSLPVDYSNIDEPFKRSCLPDCKSVRRRIFSHPLLLVGVLEAGQLPFTEPGILAELFDHEEALDYFEMVFSHYPQGYPGQSPQPHNVGVIDYLIERLGQLKTWRCMKKLGATKSQGLLERYPRSFLESLFDPIEKLSTSELVELLTDLDKCESDLQSGFSEFNGEKYQYSLDARKLEGVIEGVTFSLPEGAAEMIRAGRALHNCLKDYTLRVWRNETCIVFVKDASRLVGAIEVNLAAGEVLQALLAYNKPFSENPSLEEAYELWLQTHGLMEKDREAARGGDMAELLDALWEENREERREAVLEERRRAARRPALEAARRAAREGRRRTARGAGLEVPRRAAREAAPEGPRRAARVLDMDAAWEAACEAVDKAAEEAAEAHRRVARELDMLGIPW